MTIVYTSDGKETLVREGAVEILKLKQTTEMLGLSQLILDPLNPSKDPIIKPVYIAANHIIKLYEKT